VDANRMPYAVQRAHGKQHSASNYTHGTH